MQTCVRRLGFPVPAPGAGAPAEAEARSAGAGAEPVLSAEITAYLNALDTDPTDPHPTDPELDPADNGEATADNTEDPTLYVPADWMAEYLNPDTEPHHHPPLDPATTGPPHGQPPKPPAGWPVTPAFTASSSTPVTSHSALDNARGS